MTKVLGDVILERLTAWGSFVIKTDTTQLIVTTTKHDTALAIARAVAVAEGRIGNPSGLIAPYCCPTCESRDVQVMDSRPHKDSIRRRRKCLACGAKWSTEEKTLVLQPASRTVATATTDATPAERLGEMEALHEMEKTLPDGFRGAFRLRAILDIPPDEAATMLRLSVGHLAVRVARARAQIRNRRVGDETTTESVPEEQELTDITPTE